MKKLLKLLTVSILIFGFCDIKVDAYSYACDMKADEYSCEATKSKLQRVYSYATSGKIGKESWTKGDEVAACYLEYNDTNRTNFKGYFFNIMPAFGNTYNGITSTKDNLTNAEKNAYYHGSDNDMYAIEDRIGFPKDDNYAVVQFESSWKNKFSDKTCPKFAAHYIYSYNVDLGADGTSTDYYGGEIQFSNILNGVTDLKFDKDTTKMALLCLSKDTIIEDEINSYLKRIRENIETTIKDNTKKGTVTDTNSIYNDILEKNKSEKDKIESSIKETINPNDSKDGTVYCDNYVEELQKNVYNSSIMNETIYDTVYYSAIDACIGEDTDAGKKLVNPDNYKWYKYSKNQLAQTANPDYAKNLKNYLKGHGATDSQVSCVSKYLNMAEQVSEQESSEMKQLISSTQEQMAIARDWLDKGFTSPGISDRDMNCEEMLGKNLSKLLQFAINTMTIVGAIIVIINAMIAFIPALIAKDADALKKAEKKCITMAIVLVLILLLPTLLVFIGRLFGYDLSCFSWLL